MADLPTTADLIAEANRLGEKIDRGVQELAKSARAAAEAEHAYRKAKGQAWVSVNEGTVPERQAWVDESTADLRRERDIAEGLRVSALEALRSRRAQLSALQTVATSVRSEMDMARYSPEVGP